MTESHRDSEVMTHVFVFNKKEGYEKQIAEGIPDGRESETRTMIESIGQSYDKILERRKKMNGFGVLFVEHGRFKELLGELVQSYELGFFQSTISICGTLAERICYDFIDFAEITINDESITASQRAHLYKIPFRNLVKLLEELMFLNHENANLLNAVYDKRNEYVHLTKIGDPEKDALWCLNTISKALENLFSMFRFYDLKDGRWVLKNEYEKNNETSG